jgi:hypothetical protein
MAFDGHFDAKHQTQVCANRVAAWTEIAKLAIWIANAKFIK